MHVSKCQNAEFLWLALPSVSCNALLHTVLTLKVSTRVFANALPLKWMPSEHRLVIMVDNSQSWQCVVCPQCLPKMGWGSFLLLSSWTLTSWFSLPGPSLLAHTQPQALQSVASLPCSYMWPPHDPVSPSSKWAEWWLQLLWQFFRRKLLALHFFFGFLPAPNGILVNQLYSCSWGQ